MAFETGTATSTFDLMNKLTTFMAGLSGWTLWSNVGPYDKVYRSTGSDGYNAIYIRQRIGPVEMFLKGSDQWDYGNGDTGFLNFQSYVSFPQDGDAYAGASEIGQFGPRFLFYSGGDARTFWHQNILAQQPGGAPHIIYGDPVNGQEPSYTTNDPTCRERRRWTPQTGLNTASSIYVHDHKRFAPDSHRYLYYSDLSDGSDGMHKYSFRRTGGYYNSDGTVDRTYRIATLSWTPVYCTYFEDRRTRRPYLLVAGDSESKFAKINLMNNSVTYISGLDWPGRYGPTGLFSSGWYETQQGGMGMCWNGDRYIYFIRGGASGVDSGVSTPDWGRYDIFTNTWRCTQDPEDPEMRGFPRNPEDYSVSGVTEFSFLDKRISGFAHDRLYVTFSNRDVLYMELGDNGMPHVDENYISSFWTYQGQISAGTYEGIGRVMFNRSGRLFHGPARISGFINGIYETSPTLPSRGLAYADVKEEGLIEWKLTEPCFFPETSAGSNGQAGQDASYMFLDGYACRVRTSIGSDTEYIFIGDEDRVIIATKSNALFNPNDSDNKFEWSMAYMGAFDSHYDRSPYGELSEDVRAGFSRKIKLVNRVGTFEEGQKCFIIDTTGASYDQYFEFWNRTYTFAPSEAVVIQKVEGDTVTVSFKHDYAAGSKLSLDPQPNGLFLWEFEKFQTTNTVNRLYDDLCGSDDPGSQIYTCAIPEGEVTTSAEGAVANNAALPIWEYIISAAESECYHIGREVRGKLKGVYALGNATGISAGQTVGLDDEAYYIINLPDYNGRFILIGPIN